MNSKALFAVGTGIMWFALGANAQTGQSPEEIIRAWPATPQKVARKMISKYGQPHEMTPTHLIWHNNGPWKMTTVYKQEIPHRFPMPHTDLLEQEINYRIPAHRFDDLATYDGSVVVERTKGTIYARCDKEEMNFLALNLAHDIVIGKRSVDNARQFYAMTAKAFMSGRSSAYTKGLLFNARMATADPDRPFRRPMGRAHRSPR